MDRREELEPCAHLTADIMRIYVKQHEQEKKL
jgi:hypothetical protein